ncbi:MAG: MBL fold metallo-hydrolase [Oscillospiraceae bacterium]|nr:MBL fold metallo-hydrolase [Oscillospiraceae bacterium]
MGQKVTMTVLIDNVASEPLVSEWGLSILITADNRKILLDTGASSLFAQNAQCLGIDLADIDIGVLSHAHYDHADGLDTFFFTEPESAFPCERGSQRKLLRHQRRNDEIQRYPHRDFERT